uniref:Uncharacterized protein n=1 Tax=Glossina morsitans morsitans TaxID=37546 RepID=A0A1B0G2I8_GLOMM
MITRSSNSTKIPQYTCELPSTRAHLWDPYRHGVHLPLIRLGLLAHLVCQQNLAFLAHLAYLVGLSHRPNLYVQDNQYCLLLLEHRKDLVGRIHLFDLSVHVGLLYRPAQALQLSQSSLVVYRHVVLYYQKVLASPGDRYHLWYLARLSRRVSLLALAAQESQYRPFHPLGHVDRQYQYRRAKHMVQDRLVDLFCRASHHLQTIQSWRTMQAHVAAETGPSFGTHWTLNCRTWVAHVAWHTRYSFIALEALKTPKYLDWLRYDLVYHCPLVYLLTHHGQGDQRLHNLRGIQLHPLSPTVLAGRLARDHPAALAYHVRQHLPYHHAQLLSGFQATVRTRTAGLSGNTVRTAHALKADGAMSTRHSPRTTFSCQAGPCHHELRDNLRHHEFLDFLEGLRDKCHNHHLECPYPPLFQNSQGDRRHQADHEDLVDHPDQEDRQRLHQFPGHLCHQANQRHHDLLGSHQSPSSPFTLIPRRPGKPSRPASPGMPVGPRVPCRPCFPGIPGRPGGNPSSPSNPLYPGAPFTPFAPGKPGSPDLPGLPLSPGSPISPRAPGKPGRPNSPISP